MRIINMGATGGRDLCSYGAGYCCIARTVWHVTLALTPLDAGQASAANLQLACLRAGSLSLHVLTAGAYSVAEASTVAIYTGSLEGQVQQI